jgi:succinate dehydrogenase / fumarate reductase membrane anchor subunit
MTSEVQAAATAGTASSSTSETALARVRGHGSAREGAEHWWHERVSSLAALLLWVWFAVSLLRLPAYDRATVADWLSSPLTAVPMALLVIVTFWHLAMGMRVIVEDYVHDEGSKIFTLVLINFAAILGASFALFAVLKLALAAMGAEPPAAGPS